MVSKQEKINKAMRLLSNSYRPVKNAVKISKANTFEHELGKFLKCWELLHDGIDFYTETIFKSGGRADIFTPERFQVFEVLHSETEKEALRKLDTYPENLDIFFIHSNEIIEDNSDKLKIKGESNE